MVPTLARYQGTAKQGSKAAKMQHRKVPSWSEVESPSAKWTRPVVTRGN